MASSILFMSVSLDGFVAGPNDGPDNPGGDGFTLHDWGVSAEGDHRGGRSGRADERRIPGDRRRPRRPAHGRAGRLLGR